MLFPPSYYALIRCSASCDLALVRTGLIRVGRRVGLSSHSFLLCSAQLAYSHLCHCLVLQGVGSNILSFQKHFEGSTPFLGVPLWLVVSVIFGEGSNVDCTLVDYFRAIWLDCTVWSSQRSLLLLPGSFPCYRYSVVVFYCLYPLDLLLWQGLHSYWRAWF